MKKMEMFVCEVCGTRFQSREEALRCEADPTKPAFGVGDGVRIVEGVMGSWRSWLDGKTGVVTKVKLTYVTLGTKSQRRRRALEAAGTPRHHPKYKVSVEGRTSPWLLEEDLIPLLQEEQN